MATQQMLAAFGPRAINTVSLLHFDGTNGSTTFTDETGKSWTGNGNAQISTAQSQFGGASLLLDGTGDYLSATHSSDFDLASSNFTVECWVRPATISKQMCMISHRPNSGQQGFMFQITAAGKVGFQYSNGGTGSGSWVNLAGATTLTLNAWAYVAASYDGTTMRVFLNGNVDASTNTFDGTRADTSTPGLIGRDRDGNTTRDFNGYIDELRLTKGLARYTANFTTPTFPFVLD